MARKQDHEDVAGLLAELLALGVPAESAVLSWGKPWGRKGGKHHIHITAPDGQWWSITACRSAPEAPTTPLVWWEHDHVPSTAQEVATLLKPTVRQ